MKKIILFALLTIFSLGAFAITPDSGYKSENLTTYDKKENKMSEEEINRLTKRSEEMGNIDKIDQTIVVQEGHRRGRGHRGDMDRGNHGRGGVVFVGGGAVILLIILIIILI